MNEINENNLELETIDEDSLLNFLSGVGNHEAKLVVATILTSQPERSFTSRDLFDEVKKRQGETPTWIQHDQVAFKYCQNSLEPIGMVVKDTAVSKYGPLPAYRATDFGVEVGLPLSGALLDWSLANPDFSLQKIFGITPSTSRVRAPMVRYFIYKQLLKVFPAQLSYREVADKLETIGPSKKVLDRHLRDLYDSEIIQLSSRSRDFNPEFCIVNPGYRHSSIPYDEAKPETQIIYKGLDDLVATGRSKFNLEELLEICYEVDNDIDLAAIRKKLTQSAFRGAHGGMPSIEWQIPKEPRTQVGLREEYLLPIKSLLEVMSTVAAGQETGFYRRRAIEIINSPNLTSGLMAKAKANSMIYIGHERGAAELEARIKNIVQQLGRASVRDLMVELEKYDEKLAHQSVSIVVGKMVKKGMLGQSMVRLDPTKRTKTRVVSLANREVD